MHRIILSPPAPPSWMSIGIRLNSRHFPGVGTAFRDLIYGQSIQQIPFSSWRLYCSCFSTSAARKLPTGSISIRSRFTKMHLTLSNLFRLWILIMYNLHNLILDLGSFYFHSFYFTFLNSAILNFILLNLTIIFFTLPSLWLNLTSSAINLILHCCEECRA